MAGLLFVPDIEAFSFKGNAPAGPRTVDQSETIAGSAQLRAALIGL
ncbi:hypothetical protein [Devosia sp. Naph2]